LDLPQALRRCNFSGTLPSELLRKTQELVAQLSIPSPALYPPSHVLEGMHFEAAPAIE